MDRLQKLILGGLGFLVLSGGVAYGSVQLKENKANEIPQEIINELNKTANEQLEALLKEETEKIENKYKEELKACLSEEDTNEFKTISYYDLLLKYYENSEKDKLITEETINDNGVIDYKLNFNKDNKDYFIADNDSNKKHSYNIEHKKNTTKYKKEKTITDEIVINMTSSEKEKFDINNSKLINDYIEQLISRNLTDNEKTIINLATNMDISEFSSLKDLENYIFEDKGIKIDNLIISSNINLDDISGKYVTTFIMSMTNTENLNK